MFESSLKIGSVAGIRIGVHYTWLIIFLLMSSTLYSFFVARHPDWSGVVALGTGVVTALLFFASILLHELGHSIVAIQRGISVRSITLFVFGGVAQIERDADNALTEFLVAIAGPLVSLILAVAFHVLQIVLSPISLVAAESCGYLAYINLAVVIFNMVPGFPLDGGRVFRSLVWGFSGDPVKGMRWAVTAGKVVAYGLMGLGVFLFTSGGFLNGLWSFGIGWFLLVSAQASGQSFTMERVTHGLTVGHVMRHTIPTVPAATSIDDWVHHHVLAEGARAALVEENGSVRGIVTLSDSHKVDKGRWASTTVIEVMTPVEQVKSVGPAMAATSALEMMERYSLKQMPVVDHEEMVGWIDHESLMSALRLRMEAGD